MYSKFSDLKKLAKSEIVNSKKIKVALLGDTATQFLNVALKGTAAKEGLNIDVFEADFGQISRQILDPSSEYYEFNPDYTIVFEASHKLLNQYYKAYDNQINFAQNKINTVEELYETIQSRTKSKVIYCNFAGVDNQVFGNFANKVEYSFVFQQNKLNYLLYRIGNKEK